MWLSGVAALLLFVAFATSAYNMARPIKDGTWRTDRAGWTSTTHVQLLVVVPILVAMGILGAVIHAVPADLLASGYARLVVPGVTYGGIWGLALAAAHLFKTVDARRRRSVANPFLSTNLKEALLAWVKLTAFAVPAGAIAGYVVTKVKAEWLAGPTPFAELGMPLLVAGLMLAIIAHIGLAGTLLSDETREWWARVGGQVLLTTLLLAVLIVVAVYSPYFLAKTQERLQTAGATQILTLVWAAITGSGILAGRSSRTSNGSDPWWLSLAGKVAPFVFVVGYGVMLAVVLDRVHRPSSIGGAVLWMLIFGITAWYLSRRADLNEFSMHALYRNRLVRCYLGASNEQRQAHPFPGFDSADDVPLRVAAAAGRASALSDLQRCHQPGGRQEPGVAAAQGGVVRLHPGSVRLRVSRRRTERSGLRVQASRGRPCRRASAPADTERLFRYGGAQRRRH